MRIKNGFARIFVCGTDVYAFIISVNSRFVLYKPIYYGYVYQGFAMSPITSIYKIVYKSKQLDFFSTIMNHDASDTVLFDEPKQLIDYCFDNQKCIELSKYKWDNNTKYLLITYVDKTFFTGKIIHCDGELGREIKIRYEDIKLIKYDSIMLRNFEKYIYHFN